MKNQITILLSLGLLLVFFQKTTIEAAAVEDPKHMEKETKFVLTGTNENMALDVANLDFGEHMLVGGDIITPSENDVSIKVIEYSGSRPGWTLKVKLDKFVDSSGESINGTQLFYPLVTPITKTGGDAASKAPKSLGDSPSFTGGLKGAVVSDNDAVVPIAGAAKKNGFGEWEFPYREDNRIQLKIPRGQNSGDYRGTLTYSIEDTPLPDDI